MDEFREPYLALFRAVSRAIAAMDAQNYGTARAILVAGQQEAEELFIAFPEAATERE